MNLKKAIEIYRKHYTCIGRNHSCEFRCKTCKLNIEFEDFVKECNYIQRLIDKEDKQNELALL